MYSVKEIISLFTDHFRKDTESNLHKLMQLFSDEIQLLKETNDRIIEWRDIDKAEGKTLDLIGENVVQPRGSANDEVYRILLKTKIARNLADGTLNGLIKSIAYVLQIDTKEIRVNELWHSLDEPAALGIEAIPIEKITNVGLSYSEFETILQSLVAAGVKIMLMASKGNDYLKLYGRVYNFPVNYRITSRFRAGKTPGVIAYGDITMADESYNFTVSYKICGRFRAGMRRDINGRNTAIVSG